MPEPAFYPEQALEAHGLTPDDFTTAGVYALALDVPSTLHEFVDKWREEYQVAPPLILDEISSRPLVYVGASANLRDRLHDHVSGDKRRVGLLAVCPPTELVAVWGYPDGETARENERRHAYELREERGTACWVDGELV